MAIPIAGYIENSLIEWEGNIVSIVFLPTCNLRCHYCHSPHLVLPSEKLEKIPLENVLSSLKRNRGWVDGVVITGGEPTLHKNLDEFIKSFTPLGIKIRLDTNGTNPEVLEDLIERKLIQCVAMDIKAPLREDKCREVLGVSVNVSDIRRSIEIIMNPPEADIEYEFRTTVCPAFLDRSDILEIARAIKGARRYVLQGFKPNNCLNGEMLNVTPYPAETLREFAESAKFYVENCFVRGEEKKELCRQW